MTAPIWGTCLVLDGKLNVYEDGAWRVLDLTHETNLVLLSRCINELSTWREAAPNDIERHNQTMTRKITLEAALRDVLFEANNKHVNEVHNHRRKDVEEFCVKIRDIAADALADLPSIPQK